MMIGGASPLFLDTNILVYANIAASPMHHAALHAIQNRQAAGVELWISRQVLREYIATLSRPQTYTAPLLASVLVQRVQFFETEFHLAEDGPKVTANLLTLVSQIPMGGKQVHDANIVATMQTYGITHLLTHNVADFVRFQSLITIVPL